MTTSEKDAEILRLLGPGNDRERGMRMMMNTYQERLYWQIRKITVSHEDADDALQETFIKAYRAIGRFKGQSGLYTWLYRIATNEALTVVRRRKYTVTGIEGEMPPSMEPTTGPDAGPDAESIEKSLLDAVEILPDKQKQVFRLRYFEERPYKEISEMLDTSVGGLKALFHHAVKKVESHVLQTMERQ